MGSRGGATSRLEEARSQIARGTDTRKKRLEVTFAISFASGTRRRDAQVKRKGVEGRHKEVSICLRLRKTIDLRRMRKCGMAAASLARGSQARSGHPPCPGPPRAWEGQQHHAQRVSEGMMKQNIRAVRPAIPQESPFPQKRREVVSGQFTHLPGQLVWEEVRPSMFLTHPRC